MGKKMPIAQHLVSVGVQFRRETLQQLEAELSNEETRSGKVRQIVENYCQQRERDKKTILVKARKRKEAAGAPSSSVVLNEGRLMLSLSTISDTTDERGGTNG
jgi:hypothetical protein